MTMYTRIYGDIFLAFVVCKRLAEDFLKIRGQVATPEQSYLGEAVALLPQSGIEGRRGQKISKKKAKL